MQGSGRPPRVARAARNSRMTPTTTKSGRNAMRSLARLFIGFSARLLTQTGCARDGECWVVSWTGSVQGPYPVGNPSAQPDQKFAFPEPATGARDQTFRLMRAARPVGPSGASSGFSNVVRHKPVTFDGVYRRPADRAAPRWCGHQPAGHLRRQGQRSLLLPGESAWSDAVALPFVRNPPRRPRRPQARGELSCRRRQRSDDLARQGAARPPMSPRPAPASKGALGGRGRVSL